MIFEVKVFVEEEDIVVVIIYLVIVVVVVVYSMFLTKCFLIYIERE